MKRNFVAPLATGTLLALAVPFAAQAESSLATGSGALSTNARVDFQITIPKFVSLRVGTAGAPIDQVQFNVPAADVGTGTDVAGTGGDAGPGAVNARVLANGGNVTLTAATLGALSNGAGNTIDWTQVISTSSAPALTPPALSNTTASVTLPATLGVVSQSAVWTYTYANDNVVAGGTYGGVGLNNGRVTYTASVL